MNTTIHNLDLQTLRAANIARDKEWNVGTERVSLAFRGNELAGECGELCNIIKKLERVRIGIAGSQASTQQAADEMADVVIGVDLIAMDLQVNLGSAVAAKFNATSEKYGLSTRIQPAASEADPLKVLREALQYYADGHHFNLADRDAWDTVSGEPANFWCDEAGTATIEDGSVAKAALAGAPLPDEDVASEAGVVPVPDRDAVDLAREGMVLHSPGGPEHIVCAELVRVAEALKAASPSAPAAEPEKQAAHVELTGIAEVLAEGSGFWRSCTGCHELNEGHATGPYSTILKCNLGNGCDECGGIGAIWDTTDYQAMADAWGDPPAPSQQAAPAAKGTGCGLRAAAEEALAVIERLRPPNYGMGTIIRLRAALAAAKPAKQASPREHDGDSAQQNAPTDERAALRDLPVTNDWAVGLFYSSSSAPLGRVLHLSIGSDIDRNEKHHSFIRWVYRPAGQDTEQQRDAEPDMFWDDDDPDRCQESIHNVLVEVQSNRGLQVGDIVEVQQAIRLPNVQVRITSIEDEDGSGDLGWETIGANGDDRQQALDLAADAARAQRADKETS